MTWQPCIIGGVDVLARQRSNGTRDWVPLFARLGSACAPALDVLLSAQPQIAQKSHAPLVLQARLRLSLTLALPSALVSQMSHIGRAAFLEDVEFVLSFGTEVLGSAHAAGSAACVLLDLALPHTAALQALRAFADGAACELEVSVRSAGADAPPFTDFAGLPLHELLRDAKDQSHLRFSVVDGSSTHVLMPAWRDTPARAPRALRDAPVALVASARGEMALDLHLVADPTRKPSAAALVAGSAVGEAVRLSAQQSTLLANDWVLLQPIDPVAERPHLPLVDDCTALLWSDSSGDGVQWYAPQFELLVPQPSNDPATAAFSFLVSSDGLVTTAGGAREGLQATLCFTLSVAPSDPVMQALRASGNPQSRQVPLNGLSVVLELSHRCSGSPTLADDHFQVSVAAESETLRCTAQLLDDWARLVYSAISGQAEASSLAVSVRVSYSFLGIEQVDAKKFEVVAGNKRVGYETVATRAEILAHSPLPVLVADERTLVSSRAELSFPQEQRGLLASRVALPALTTLAARQRIGFMLDPAVRPGRLEEYSSVAPQPDAQASRTVTRSVIREDRMALSFPCSDYGPLYLQTQSDGTLHAVGCQNALTLGETAVRPFEEIVELRKPDYRVWRSLKQPGRFMVQPAAYRVGRYAASHPTDAFRPMMMLYGSLTADPAADRYTLSAGLAADVSAAQMALLRQSLIIYCPNNVAPQVFLPTDPDVVVGTHAAWAAPGSGSPPQTMVFPDCVTATFTVAAADALLLTTMINQSGVSGVISFVLSDGTTLDCALLLDGLTAGPSDTGPVTVTVAAETATLTNRTQQPMNAFMLVMVQADGSVVSAPAAVTLAPGASAQVATPVAAISALAHAKPAQRASLQELDIFVEDVTQLVQFVNQVNFANHGIRMLVVTARLQGTTHAQDATLAEQGLVSLSFTLPITAYLTPRNLEFALTVSDAAGVRTTEWQSHPLQSGCVIGVTADLL